MAASGGMSREPGLRSSAGQRPQRPRRAVGVIMPVNDDARGHGGVRGALDFGLHFQMFAKAVPEVRVGRCEDRARKSSEIRTPGFVCIIPRWARDPVVSRCHVAATRLDKKRKQQGRSGNSRWRKPAWSLQMREMVEDLGLRLSGSSPVRSANFFL
jgi:hypothetical protein